VAGSAHAEVVGEASGDSRDTSEPDASAGPGIAYTKGELGSMRALGAGHGATRLRLGAVMAVAAACLVVMLAGAAQAHASCLPSTRVPPPKHRILRVGSFNGKKGQCKTIQEAVKAAAPGNWILIGPGDYKQSSSEQMPGAVGDDRAGADIVITTPNLHIRGMNRNSVMIDGTKPGHPECSSEEGAQYLGTPEGSGYSGNNGIVVYKAEGVWLQNFSACNFVSGNKGGGDEIWSMEPRRRASRKCDRGGANG